LARDDLIQIKGTIVEALAGGNYRVKGDNGMEFLAKIGGRMRRFHIRVIPGDRVTIAVSPYDPTHGLIVFRGAELRPTRDTSRVGTGQGIVPFDGRASGVVLPLHARVWLRPET